MEQSKLTPVLKAMPGDRFTPIGLADKLTAKVILESATYGQGRSRYSLLMIKEAFRLEQWPGQLFFCRQGRSETFAKVDGDLLDAAEYFAAQHRSLHQDMPFPAGGIGFLGYEFCRYCDSINLADQKDPLKIPEAVFIFGHLFIVFDHYSDMIYLIGVNYKEAQIDLEKAIIELETHINDLNFNYLMPRTEKHKTELVDDGCPQTYKEQVESIRKDIIAGQMIQAVPSRRLTYKTNMPALSAYKRLRVLNPSPYMFYIDFGGYQLFGASPEVHLKIKESRAQIMPIAGTCRRGGSADEDEKLAKGLALDPKERAEHLMLVDLARNDLGRFCQPGSVKVDKFCQTELYSHVIHLVSEVVGKLNKKVSAAQALRATFPAGTVSGAPKIKAIETISRLEPLARRFYAGVVGYLEPEGSLNTCITIRSALKKGDKLFLQAGGGIVFDSKAERELTETNEKLAALVKILEDDA